jgi:membrane peptidoglycan carboxypeptidase
VYDGTSPRVFDGRTVRKTSGGSCDDPCTLRKATELSTNTVFYDLVRNEVGTQAVADAAHAAGIPEQVDISGTSHRLLAGDNGSPPDLDIAVGGGRAKVRPFDMTAAYATLASGGSFREPYFIEKIVKAGGELVYQHADQPRAAFDPDLAKSRDIAGNITDALKPIPAAAGVPCANNRECAGKTGVHELPDTGTEYSKAWMAGYTPSLAAAVWMGTESGTTSLRDNAGRPIDGGGLPGRIWQKFMDKALAGTPPEAFPAPNPIGQFN